jgi:uncharacterized nucleotidyltransferase DUF6036
MSVSISQPGHPSRLCNRPIEPLADGTHIIGGSLHTFLAELPYHPIQVLSIIETIEPLPRCSPLSALTAEQVIELLTNFTRETGESVEIIIVRALALQAYGYQNRVTRDLDAEVVGPIEPLTDYLRQHSIPADLTTNFSGRSVISMPPGYRDRATDLAHHSNLRVRLLAPIDFIIAKLRRGTDLDLDDAAFVAKRFHLTSDQIRTASSAAIAASPKDTALFLFRKTVDLFCQSLNPEIDR